MDPNKNKEIVKRWYEEVWNQKRENAIDNFLTENSIPHGLADENGKPITGREDFKPFFRKFIESFPDLHIRVEDMIAEGDKVAARCHVSLSHKGKDFPIGSKNIPSSAAAKQIEFTGITITVIRDGKIAEAWNNWDFMSMYMQMGAIQLVQTPASS